MIRSFRTRATERVFRRERVRAFANIEDIALKRLTALDSAQFLDDLRFPPGHRLEALSGDRKGQHSIRVNDQYRVCFIWKDGHAYDVEITKHYR